MFTWNTVNNPDRCPHRRYLVFLSSGKEKFYRHEVKRCEDGSCTDVKGDHRLQEKRGDRRVVIINDGCDIEYKTQ